MKMTVSYEWLCSLVPDLDKKNPDEIAEAFTSIGAETEDFKALNWGRFCKLAKVQSISPLSGKNKHVIVETEGKTYHTVSNSKKLKEGDQVLFVPEGGEIYGGRSVDAKTIDGIKTQGLLSALEYLGIEEKSPDIYIFKPESAEDDFKILTEKDAVYTLDISGNRPDWLSVSGLARSLAVFFDLPYKASQASFIERSASSVPVKIESERCFSFSARLIQGVTVKASPMLIQKRLLLLGMRPINNMVDFSNHIMLETGQPTHAYDASVISQSFIIRQAKKGEKLTLLGGDKEIELTEEDLLICDEEKILGLAGIMGGASSKVTPETTAIILESATFHGVYIRRSAKRLGLKTESSVRYEKNIAPSLTETADALFTSYFPGAEIAKKTETIKTTLPNPSISLKPSFIREKLGTEEISDAFIKKVFLGLGCTIKEAQEWQITPPPERFDLKIPEDFVEEAARFYGYNNIPARSYRPSNIILSPEILFQDRLRPMLRGMGLHEAVTVSLVSAKDRALFHIKETPVSIENPLTEDFSELHTHLFYGLIRTIVYNKQKAFISSLAFSEIGRVFRKDNNNFIEEQHLAFALTEEQRAYEKALNILNNISSCAKFSWTSCPADQNYGFLHPKNSFVLSHEGKFFGFFGALHPSIEAQLELENVIVCELNFEALKKSSEKKESIQIPGIFPPVLRDITLTVNKETQGHNIAEQLKKENHYLKQVEFLGVYENAKLQAEGKKNLTLRLRFESSESLRGEEIDAFITELLAKKL